MIFISWYKMFWALAGAVPVLVLLLPAPTSPVFAHAKGPMMTPANGSELNAVAEALDFNCANPVRLTAVRLCDAEHEAAELPGKRSIKPAKTRRIALPPLVGGADRV